ncbi:MULTISPECIES: acyl carrier protein [Saccharopolyspora]|uniref:Acyl carrier protein n=2 Tax=Saccharopolyspora TaxID=1835 RepID=A0A4R4Y252_9PSEU|nr:MULTISPECIES: phosphopantetheine-binding protein [Saccharopolyspora]TDD37740.1 acyl carrier protein [Saccharopolyspora elongata]SDZ37965.1 acyl carrier protein [Saccharopolyspora shandongensis]
MSDLYTRLGELLTSTFDVETPDLRPDASLDDLGLDSLAQVELGELLEQHFGVEVTDAEMEKMATLTDILEALEKKGVTV